MHLRVIEAHTRRAGSDPIAFAALWHLRDAYDRALAGAVDTLRAKGFSWARIAVETGLSKQALCQWRRRQDARSGVNDPYIPAGGGR